MSAKQKFSDIELLRFIHGEQRTVNVGPSIKACARKFGVAYQSMSERVHRLRKKSYLSPTDYGVVIWGEGEQYINAIDKVVT